MVAVADPGPVVVRARAATVPLVAAAADKVDVAEAKGAPAVVVVVLVATVVAAVDSPVTGSPVAGRGAADEGRSS